MPAFPLTAAYRSDFLQGIALIIEKTCRMISHPAGHVVGSFSPLLTQAALNGRRQCGQRFLLVGSVAEKLNLVP